MTEQKKPLELTWHEAEAVEPHPHDPGFTWDRWREWNEAKTRSVFDRLAKRLTDAELSAEYWHASWAFEAEIGLHIGPDGERVIEADVMERFASRPHAALNGYQ